MFGSAFKITSLGWKTSTPQHSHKLGTGTPFYVRLNSDIYHTIILFLLPFLRELWAVKTSGCFLGYPVDSTITAFSARFKTRFTWIDSNEFDKYYGFRSYLVYQTDQPTLHKMYFREKYVFLWWYVEDKFHREKIGRFKSTLDTLEALLTHMLRQEASSSECNSDKINIDTE